MEEIWKTIDDFPNYEVSTFGNVKNKTTNKILKLQKTYSGYLKVSLINNIKKNVASSVHRLVAKTFISNPENKPTVNHIDSVRNNNHIYNLEWATMSEQNKHLILNKKPILKNLNYIPVYKIDKISNIIIEKFDSISHAALWLIDNNLSKIRDKNRNSICIVSSKICAVANNKRNFAYNFRWRYIINNESIINENWKEIPFEILGKNNYFVSDLGRFKNNKNIIKTNYSNDSGYIRIAINKKLYLLHRLIALTFLENPQNKEFVNHKDGNKLNNSLSNLEWATCLENNLHKINNGMSNCTKKIIQYDQNMMTLKEHNSIVECAKELHISSSCISDNCRGKTKSTKCGYIFRYV
jgi:hypothetical protein